MFYFWYRRNIIKNVHAPFVTTYSMYHAILMPSYWQLCRNDSVVCFQSKHQGKTYIQEIASLRISSVSRSDTGFESDQEIIRKMETHVQSDDSFCGKCLEISD
jgi:hypothetical protein